MQHPRLAVWKVGKPACQHLPYRQPAIPLSKKRSALPLLGDVGGGVVLGPGNAARSLEQEVEGQVDAVGFGTGASEGQAPLVLPARLDHPIEPPQNNSTDRT